MKTANKKIFGFWILLSLVIGNVIGSGIFLLPASLAQYGTISIFSWVLTSCGAIFLALTLAHLSRQVPRTGGPYAYCYHAFGGFLGFQVATNYWLSLWIANAALVVSIVGYLSFFFPLLNTNHLLAFAISSSILWVVTAINLLGLREAGFMQVVMSSLKLLLLSIIICVGCFFMHPHYLLTFNVSHTSNFHALTTAATLTFWAFLGLESATVPADNVINPEKNIPRATLCGTLIAAFLYIVGTIVIMAALPMATLAHSTAPFADAAQLFLGKWGGILVAIAALISSFGALNGLVLMQGQIPLAAARDKLFPECFTKITRKEVPIVGLLVSSVLINLLLALSYNETLVSQFTLIILLATLANLIPYFYSTMADILLMLKSPAPLDRKSFIRHTLIAGIAFLFMLWIIIGAGEKIVFYGTILTLACTPMYVWMKRKGHSAI